MGAVQSHDQGFQAFVKDKFFLGHIDADGLGVPGGNINACQGPGVADHHLMEQILE